MRKRNIRIMVRLNEQENLILLENLNNTGLKKEQYLRMLIMGYVPKKNASEEFKEVIRQLRAIGNNLNQLTLVANKCGYIDKERYGQIADSLSEEILEIRKIVLRPEKIDYGNNSNLGCE